jgi:REP element-mobilizing transposase RayT
MPWIGSDLEEPLYDYIGGIIRSQNGVLYAVGGVEDHVHLYLRWRTDSTISDLMQKVKAQSSKWIHCQYPSLQEFAWQSGYSVFSVSKSKENSLKRYIAFQKRHHAKTDFQTELLRFLRMHEVEFEAGLLN